MTENPTAKRAREVALERHRAELEAVNKRADKWKWYAHKAMQLLVGVFIVLVVSYYKMNEPWRNETPPVQQKLKVVTYGWYHQTKGWCSYETGEPITVIEWQSQ